MKILQTSDVLVGRDFRELPELAEELRQARLDVLSSLVALAEKERVEALVLVGNTLADNRISHRTLMDVSRLLGASSVPVLILPGETDPLTPDSPYELRADLFQEPVRVLRKSEPVELKSGLTFYPCPITRREGTSDLSWIPPRGSDTGLRVGLAVGDPPASHGLDYLALGGSLDRQESYSGTPEPVDYEGDSGSALVVELVPLKVHPVKVARWSWQSVELEVGSPPSLQHPGGRNVLLRVRLTGSLPEDELGKLDKELERLASRCRHLSVINEVGVAAPVGYRHPLLQRMAASLQTRAAAVTVDPGELPESSEVAREALVLLRKLIARSGQEDLR
ncbi:MAG: hypothetical protein AMXMBFR33_12850 [Candidatus Xenobia bacterium]